MQSCMIFIFLPGETIAFEWLNFNVGSFIKLISFTSSHSRQSSYWWICLNQNPVGMVHAWLMYFDGFWRPILRGDSCCHRVFFPRHWTFLWVHVSAATRDLESPGGGACWRDVTHVTHLLVLSCFWYTIRGRMNLNRRLSSLFHVITSFFY